MVPRTGLVWGSSKVPSSWVPHFGLSPTNQPFEVQVRQHSREPKAFHPFLKPFSAAEMFPTAPLLQAARVTLFTRAGCGLCDTAKYTLIQVQKRRPFDYSEIDIMTPGNKAWKDVYEFDVPVLHVQSIKGATSELSDPEKLFHRFSEQEVETLVDDMERTAS